MAMDFENVYSVKHYLHQTVLHLDILMHPYELRSSSRQMLQLQHSYQLSKFFLE